MSRLFVVTDRRLVAGDFLAHLKKIISAQPQALILREKDLSFSAYFSLVDQLAPLCRAAAVQLILNWRAPVMRYPGTYVQLPFAVAKDQPVGTPFAVSVHRPDEIRALNKSSTLYFLLGNIFETSCKPGKAAAGLVFLSRCVQLADKPVIAIGGITPGRVPAVLSTGAAGYAVRSPLMTADDPARLIQLFHQFENLTNKEVSQ